MIMHVTSNISDTFQEGNKPGNPKNKKRLLPKALRKITEETANTGFKKNCKIEELWI